MNELRTLFTFGYICETFFKILMFILTYSVKNEYLSTRSMVANFILQGRTKAPITYKGSHCVPMKKTGGAMAPPAPPVPTALY